jgi:hypothetical protein
MRRAHVALNPPRRVGDFLVFAKVIGARLGEDPLFSPPASLLASLQSGIGALEAAVVAGGTRRIGAAAERSARQEDVHATLRALRVYVQTLADAGTAEEAAMIAARAGMSLKDAKGPRRPALTLKAGRVSGSLHAVAKAATSRAGYEWQVRREGEEWTTLPVTMRADAELHGLVPGTLMWVRARALTADGPSDWLAPVSAIVE